jgi:voltage-gated potassium channel
MLGTTLPEKLRELDVVHVSEPSFDNQALQAASVYSAYSVILVAPRSTDASSDSLHFELTDRLRSNGFTGRIIAEAVRDENRARLHKAGANHVVRPIRSYPELLVRTIIAPGAEHIIEGLFSSHDEECIRYDVKGSEKWSTIIQRLVAADIGIPLGFLDTQQQVITNARPDQQVEFNALFVLIREGNLHAIEQVQQALRMNAAA